MFNGIIESLGKVVSIDRLKNDETSEFGKTFIIQPSFSASSPDPDFADLNLGSSVSINGVCTTVTEKGNRSFSCFASSQTLEITNLADLQVGDLVNLERALVYRGRIDGHLVYGHVDTTFTLTDFKMGKSGVFRFALPEEQSLAPLVPKGSIALNGISLTLYQINSDSIEVMIIPHTYRHTNFHLLKEGDRVNVEFDMMGKYLKKYFDHYEKPVVHRSVDQR